MSHGGLGQRLAPGQSTAEIAPVVERLLREAAPYGATVDVDLRTRGEPGYVEPETMPRSTP